MNPDNPSPAGAKAHPNFLIAGAAKSGTTSLYAWLKQHKDVFLPDLKEPTYFVDHYSPLDWDGYLSLFQAGADCRMRGEASASYLAAPEAAQRIYNALGPIKIILLLRDPVQRARSLHRWMVMAGYEWIGDFEQALAEEDKRITDDHFRKHNPEYFWSYMYFHSGLYHEQVDRFFRVFGRDRVRVFLFEELVHQSAWVYEEACRHLEIAPGPGPRYEAHNPSRSPRWSGLQFALRSTRDRSVSGSGPWARPVRIASQHLMAMNLAVGRDRPETDATNRRLRQAYRDDVRRLSNLINLDLSGWTRKGHEDASALAA